MRTLIKGGTIVNADVTTSGDVLVDGERIAMIGVDLDLVTEVRQTWQFYRDRRPDQYGDLVRP
jgi:N-carbamoylputrescine amidase